VAEAFEAGWLTSARESAGAHDASRAPAGTQPDALEVVEVDDEEIVEGTQPQWALEEMDVEEIDVKFD